MLSRLVASARSETAMLEIYDVSGRRVRHIRGSMLAGFIWDGRDDAGWLLPAGVYVQRLAAGPHTWVAKALLIR